MSNRADFASIRKKLAAKRAEYETCARNLSVQHHRLKLIERRLKAFEQSASAADPKTESERRKMEEAAKTLRAGIATVERQRSTLSTESLQLLTALGNLGEPAEQVAQLPDTHPILLFPLRIETRFKTVVSGGLQKPQLWVRVYPDDCQIDSFEEPLSEGEVESARLFWVEMWKANGDEARERGAWKVLVQAHGSGRALWIVQHRKPLNPQDKPVKGASQDVVLIIAPQINLQAQEELVACTYWIERWKARNDPAKREDALNKLHRAVGRIIAEEILQNFRPQNAEEDPPAPFSRDGVKVTCVILRMGGEPADMRPASWTAAPKAVALPDRLVFMAYRGDVLAKRVVGAAIPDGLAVGPDPSLPQADQIQLVNGELTINADLRWTVDFEEAVRVGMGVKIDLNADEAANGFDRLLVLGVRTSSEATEGQGLLEKLLTHHHYSNRGLSLVPQGSPTNNTESEGTGYSWTDDADAAYDVAFKGKEDFVETFAPLDRRDGECLSVSLGINAARIKGVPHANGRDQGEARAAQTALWPATLGYFMEEMMRPIFSTADIDRTRQFFIRYVSGRGPVPAIRVGRQPYGILPAMAFSCYKPSALRNEDPVNPAYLTQLHSVLSGMDAVWAKLAKEVSHVGQSSGTPHQVLLDVIGLHAGSVEYHQRYAESLGLFYNLLVFQFGMNWVPNILHWFNNTRSNLLSLLGAPNVAFGPPILEKLFCGTSTLLTGPVVDDVPLSEVQKLREIVGGKNYIEWLATSSLETIRTQNFGQAPAPTALLYLFLRHALMLAQWDAGMRLLTAKNLVDPAVARKEPDFIHVANNGDSESKFFHLYKPQPTITLNPEITLADYLLTPQVLGSSPAAKDLSELLTALKFLKDAPTARLERVFAEHIDTCSYRLDAWKTGLASKRLEDMRRYSSPKGIYLGAYGWLEAVKPKAGTLTQITPPRELAGVFGKAPLYADSTNAGYIHAPSPDHAAAAAILRNAYVTQGANSDMMAVNLSSERVRKALWLLEGIRNGQTFGALLGYQFERGLHERHNDAEVDQFIYPLRGAFPLVADKLASTKAVDNVDIRQLEASNVIDGLRLVNHIRDSGNKNYPFGLLIGTERGKLPNASTQVRDVINAEVNTLLDMHDAVADLMLAESVYQVVRGNFERSAASAEAVSNAHHPPEPEVIKTPRGGTALTHRIAVHLDAGAESTLQIPLTPRAKAQTAFNAWLGSLLPDTVVCVVQYGPEAEPREMLVSQHDLGLHPIDLLFLLDVAPDQAMVELDDRIMYYARRHPDIGGQLSIDIRIRYTQLIPERITFFEVSALVKSLRALFLKSRALTPRDIALARDAGAIEPKCDFADLEARISEAAYGLKFIADQLSGLQANAGFTLDELARRACPLFLAAALHGIPQTGIGAIYADIQAVYHAIRGKLSELIVRWDENRIAFDTLIGTLGGIADEAARFKVLRKAELLIAAHTTANLPATSAQFEGIVLSRKQQFENTLAQLNGLADLPIANSTDFAAMVVAAQPSIAECDVVPFSIADQEAAIARQIEALLARVTALKDDIDARVTIVGEALTQVAAMDDEARLRRMIEVASQVLGDEMKLLPRFELPDTQREDLQRCVDGSESLIGHLQKHHNRQFPVDDWLYGAARVREKLHSWENMVFLAEGFVGSAPELTALQMPYLQGEGWLALELPEEQPIDDRLLYTAHFAIPPGDSRHLCGWLIDEWVEVLPRKEEVTGLAFHFDRPSAEPPQAMLLAVPPAVTGQWSWEDLVAMLHETLDAAKARAVEPAQIGTTHYAQLLPATVMAVTLYQITISTNLAVSNKIYDVIGK